jgi:RNA polymerase sigma-70 factor (ECF subfamily)
MAVAVANQHLGLLFSTSAATSMEKDRAERDNSIREMTRGLVAGSEEAFRTFHSAYFDRLLRYHLVIARGDEITARDALQETLLRVVRHARVFETEAALWGWLALLARSAACDGGRRRQRYWQMLSEYTRSLFGNNSEVIVEPNVHLHEILGEVLCELPPEDRMLLEHKYFHGGSVREIAEQAGLTEKAIESRLLRARRELRERMTRKLRDET